MSVHAVHVNVIPFLAHGGGAEWPGDGSSGTDSDVLKRHVAYVTVATGDPYVCRLYY